jgi:hypothetical protein
MPKGSFNAERSHSHRGFSPVFRLTVSNAFPGDHDHPKTVETVRLT